MSVRFVFVFCFGLLPLVFVGCPSPTNSTSANQVLVYGRGEDADTLDPINTEVGEAVKVIHNLYDTLVTYDDKTLDLVPALATSLGETSEDGLTWTFPIRKGVKFHDGSTLDAHAVVFSIERLIERDHPHAYEKSRPYRPMFNMLEKVEATDDYTVQFTLNQPSAVFLRNLAMFPASIVSPQAVKERGKKFAANPVGTGPFQLDNWSPDEKLVLKAFADHWRGAPRSERAIFLPVSESATRVQQMKRGEIHIADNLPPGELDSLLKEPGVVAQQQPGLNVAYLALNTEKPPLDNANVRRAIALALNKEEIVRVAYKNHATTAVTMLPRNMTDWFNAEIEDRPHDVEQAKSLIKAYGNENGIALPITLNLAVMSKPRPYMQRPKVLATSIKDALASIGVVVELSQRDVNQHFDYLMKGNHELGLAGWSSDNNDPDNFLYMLLDEDNIGDPETGGGMNLSRFRHDRLHELLMAGQTEMNVAKRREIYNEAQQIIFDEAPVIPLVHTTVRVALRKNVKGYYLHPSSNVRLRNAYLESAN